ncbi:hypothetical protein DV736_g3535, partial [Chaetothyriales sp. CBS 134916]
MVKRKRPASHQNALDINGAAAKTPKTDDNDNNVNVSQSTANIKYILNKAAGVPEPATVNGAKQASSSAKNEVEPLPAVNGTKASTAAPSSSAPWPSQTIQTIQIITGSYESILHGITATISRSAETVPEFSDTFLFKAHSSSIRCLGLSPPPDPNSDSPQGIYLATGSSDERVNVYSLSVSPLPQDDGLPRLPTLGMAKLRENPANRELGNIVQHSAPITSLHFPSRSKLLSASEDNTIAVTRTRDLEVVSSIKAPRPKVQGQPSGDTAPPGMTPMGINDFAVHPSMKLMVTVGKGEKCMRLWNLLTGKKAGVLNFDRKMLEEIKEGKYSSGEGRKIEWDGQGKRFVVAFERGVLVFGEDSRVHCKISLWPTKLCQMRWVPLGQGQEALAVSTEDGRLVFFDVAQTRSEEGEDVRHATVLGQLGGKEAGEKGRIKDFEILTWPEDRTHATAITAGSDGAVKIWRLPFENLAKANKQGSQVGKLLATYETGNRITCLRAFVMQPPREEDAGGLSEFEGLTSAAEESSESNEEEQDDHDHDHDH